jgi:ferredoxin
MLGCRVVRFADDIPASTRPAIDREATLRIAEMMQALSAPNRVRILSRLAESPCSVGELVTAVELEQSAVSHHLRLLRERGFVVCRRRGREAIYALHRNHVRAALQEATSQLGRPLRRAGTSTVDPTGEPRHTSGQRRYQAVTYIIAEPCIDVKDKSCIDVCPVDCIHEFDRILIIDPEECIDCGACEPECPVEAIYPEDALPDKWEPFVKINYAYPNGESIDALVNSYAKEHNVQNTPPAA